ncbi:MAG: PTS sugar transporter subunit IIA [Gammaproteobacteria bacterium]
MIIIMQLIDFLPLAAIRVHVVAQSKKRALEIASEVAASNLNNSKLTLPILEALINRERLGSTGIGHGVGIPHCRLDGLKEPLMVLMTLEKGIDYQGIDNQRVDIILTILVPAESTDLHLQLLATIAEQFSKPHILERIRHAKTVQILYDTIANLTDE